MKAFAYVVTAVLGVAGWASGDEFGDLLGRHPAGGEVAGLFGEVPGDFKQTGLMRKDYLPLIAGNVDFWKNLQNAAGAVEDPYEKKERQYSTPAFALAAALLVQEEGRKDLLEPASRALTFSVDALVNKTTADQHADFYIPMVIHAHRILTKQGASGEQAEAWAGKIRSLVPEKTYRDVTGGGNWNIVNVSGELLRRKDGLVPGDRIEAHAAYVEKCLARQEREFTKFGMYRDPNSPLAYDAFPRLWLEDVFADGAYEGERAKKIEAWLRLGGVSSLLLMSPSGEWAAGGRSGQHQWNEAQNAVIAECNANYWKARGNDAAAGAFKRSARLGLLSMKRWQRPTGEMWIVKNFADPARRHGYEGYSFNSQYNLLPAAMLAIAYLRADDSIEERPTPGEAGAYVFDLRETFHKVVAGVKGMYVEVETSADPHYNSTGLQRVMRAGVALSPLSESAPAHRWFEGHGDRGDHGLSPGVQWREAEGGAWRSLADFVSTVDGVDKKKPATDVVRAAELEVREGAKDRRAFVVRYELKGAGARPVEEEYVVTGDMVEVTSRVGGEVAATRVALPVLVFDGARATRVTIDGGRVRVERVGGVLSYEVVEPAGVRLSLVEPKLVTRNGYVQAAVGELPAGVREVKYRIKLEPGKDAMR